MKTFTLRTSTQTNQPLTLVVGDDLVDEYLAWLAGRKSENTRLAYGYDLTKLLTWVVSQASQGVQSYLDLRPRQLLQFVTWVSHQPVSHTAGSDTQRTLSAATVRRVVRAVTSFYDYLVLTERLRSSPVPHRAAAEAPALNDPVRRRPSRTATAVAPIDSRLPAETLSDAEIETFLTSLRSKRDRLLFELLLVSGLRVSEALNLRLPDVQFAEQSLRIQPVPASIPVRAVHNRQPKRASNGIVGVHPTWLAHLNDYLTTEYPGNPDEFIFVVLKGAHRGQQLTYKGYHAIVAYHRAKVKTPRVRPHRARHTFATKALRAGLRREVLKKQLRHASPRSLDQYAWVDEQELLRELAQVQDTLL
jgi:integrase